MHYYEVLVANSGYHGNTPLTYSYEDPLPNMSVVAVPLRSKIVTGFVLQEVNKPPFATKSIKNLLSTMPLPLHTLELAQWLSQY
jgi:primosomal protein N'